LERELETEPWGVVRKKGGTPVPKSKETDRDKIKPIHIAANQEKKSLI